MQNASLVLAGSGIKFLAHLTMEARAYIEQSDKVLYLVNDPAMKEWIKKNTISAESLDNLYTKYPSRKDCYLAITDHILARLREMQHVCVVLYGHPSVFAKPGLDAVLQAKKEGFYSKILPGISAEDCLYSDLMIDPGSCGCQSFEATDFLIYRREFDVSSHLILWQIDIIGVQSNPEEHDSRRGAELLVEYLGQKYSLEHEVFIYEAAQYPSFEPKINRLLLCQLPNARFSRISTLYIPPIPKTSRDESILKLLNIAY